MSTASWRSGPEKPPIAAGLEDARIRHSGSVRFSGGVKDPMGHVSRDVAPVAIRSL